MKEMLIAVPLLLLLGVFWICGGNVPVGQGMHRFQPEKEMPLQKCETLECVNASLDTCAPSEFNTDMNGTVIRMEIRGHSSAGECIVYIKLIALNPEVVPPAYRFMVESLKGADGICAFTDQDIKDIKSGDIDQKYLLSKCEGRLKTLAEMRAP